MTDVLSTCVRWNTGLVEVIVGMGSGRGENYGEDVTTHGTLCPYMKCHEETPYAITVY
jgi:hypothetical protein